METSIDEITGEIYREGIEKSNREAEKILNEANQEKEKILKEARDEAKSIIDHAHKQAAESKRNSQAEIKLIGQQAINRVRQSIINLIANETLSGPVSNVLSDPDNIKEFLVLFLKNWRPESGKGIEAILPADQKDALDDSIKGAIKKIFDGNIKINFSESVETGFRIGPDDGSYHISLTAEDFNEFFKAYLKPKSRELIFGS